MMAVILEVMFRFQDDKDLALGGTGYKSILCCVFFFFFPGRVGVMEEKQLQPFVFCRRLCQNIISPEVCC